MIQLILLIVAIVLFLFAAFSVNGGRVSLTALGLAAFAGSFATGGA